MNSNARVTALPGTIPTWSFADRLRKARREYSHFTQQQMADALDVGLKAYSAWESGKSKTPQNIAEIAVKLEQITGVPRTWFLGWVDDENAPTPEGEGAAIPRLSDYKPAVSQATKTTGGVAPVTPIRRAAA